VKLKDDWLGPRLCHPRTLGGGSNLMTLIKICCNSFHPDDHIVGVVCQLGTSDTKLWRHGTRSEAGTMSDELFSFHRLLGSNSVAGAFVGGVLPAESDQ
jgi:hypothetical protein